MLFRSPPEEPPLLPEPKVISPEVTPLPNLVVSSIIFSPDLLIVENAVTVSAFIENTGLTDVQQDITVEF